MAFSTVLAGQQGKINQQVEVRLFGQGCGQELQLHFLFRQPDAGFCLKPFSALYRMRAQFKAANLTAKHYAFITLIFS